MFLMDQGLLVAAVAVWFLLFWLLLSAEIGSLRFLSLVFLMVFACWYSYKLSKKL